MFSLRINPAVCSTTGWETIKGEANDEDAEAVTSIQVDSSSLPLTTNESGDQVMRFYWLDSYEDPYKQPGVYCVKILMVFVPLFAHFPINAHPKSLVFISNHFLRN